MKWHKHIIITGTLLVQITGQLVLAQRMGRGRAMGMRQPGMQNANFGTVCAQLPKQPLDVSEKEALVYMREEEKLARDVYLALNNKWNFRVFANIARSEQRHTDAVALLLKKYNIEDPVKNDSLGAFTNPELAGLYKQLVAKGQKSLKDALIVGATIEDLDIYDLDKRLAITDNEDVTCVFKNLRRGSENHMRAFIRQLRANGGTYKPQYISEKEFNSILNSAGGHQGRGGMRGRRSFRY